MYVSKCKSSVHGRQVIVGLFLYESIYRSFLFDCQLHVAIELQLFYKDPYACQSLDAAAGYQPWNVSSNTLGD